MSKVKFGDIVREVKVNVDRENNPYEFYVAGDHMDSEDLTIRRKGRFDTDDVGPAFTRIFKPGQILYGSRRTYLKKVAVADFEGICANTTFVLESKDPNVFCQELLPFIMLSDEFSKWSIGHSKGSTNPYVLFGDLAGYTLDLPSIEEQKVLADKLWAAYKVKESYRQLLSTTDEMLKAKFQEMFGDGKWEQKKWSDVLSVLNGKAYPAEYQESGTYPIYGSGGIMAYGEKKLCEGNTIIIGRKGNINNPIFVKDPYWAVDTAFSISVKPEFLVPIYMYFWCKNFDFNVYNKQGVLPSLTKSDLENIIMGIPPIDMQKEFASIYTQAEATKASLRASIEAIDRVIRSLINQ